MSLRQRIETCWIELEGRIFDTQPNYAQIEVSKGAKSTSWSFGRVACGRHGGVSFWMLFLSMAMAGSIYFEAQTNAYIWKRKQDKQGQLSSDRKIARGGSSCIVDLCERGRTEVEKLEVVMLSKRSV